jgi:hypothetical protein
MEGNMKLIIKLSVLVSMLFLGAGLAAHVGHAMPAPAPTAQPTPAAYVIQLPQALFDHMHNKLVHFPVALGCLAALLILLSYRWPEFQISVRLILFLAACGALAAYFSGKNQANEFMVGPLSGILGWHKTMGTATMVWLWAGAILSFIPWAKKIMWVYAGFLVAAVIATGFLGGILAGA